MSRSKFYPALIIVIVISAGAGFWAWQSGFFTDTSKHVPISEGIILFYGQDCPHCKNVEDFMDQNNIQDKVKVTQLEVYYNEDNQNILAQVAKKCNINLNQIGVPLLWDGQNCTEGDQDIINFFSKYITNDENTNNQEPQ